MLLPPRVYYPIAEVAGRWGCSIADIAEWASADRLELVTGISPTHIGTETVAGFVVISPADILPMFRRTGTGQDTCHIRRIRAFSSDHWQYIPSDQEPIAISREDILVMAAEVARFEEEWTISRRGGDSGGAPSRYDWDGFYVEVIRHIHDHGVPKRQAELVAGMQEWFILNSKVTEPPQESTIRKKISPIWNALRPRG